MSTSRTRTLPYSHGLAYGYHESDFTRYWGITPEKLGGISWYRTEGERDQAVASILQNPAAYVELHTR